MEHYALKLRFLGTRYCGWQVQKNGVSVQRTLQDALSLAFGERIPVTGCSRTDAGVHAKCFVCVADGIPAGIPAERIPEAVNSRLPSDIAVEAAARVPADFHPRYRALAKTYVYTLRNARLPDPFTAETTALFPTKAPLDETALHAICGQFCGKHDFRSFMASGSAVSDTVRTVSRFSCERDGEYLFFTVEADGFLYNMVRILVGTALDLYGGVLKTSPREILEAKDRTLSGRTMPPHGLCLTDVRYPEPLFGRNEETMK